MEGRGGGGGVLGAHGQSQYKKVNQSSTFQGRELSVQHYGDNTRRVHFSVISQQCFLKITDGEVTSPLHVSQMKGEKNLKSSS